MTTTPILNAQDPVYPQVPKAAQCVCTAAKTTYADAANAVLLLTAGADGGEVTYLGATPRATVGDTQLQLYLSLDGGSTLALLATEKMAACTMAQTTQAPTVAFKQAGAAITDANVLRLPANARLYAAIGVAVTGGVQFVATHRDF